MSSKRTKRSVSKKVQVELKALTRDEILAAQDVPEEWVDVPEWNGKVFVRGLTLETVTQLQTQAGEEMDDVERGMRMAILCIVDHESGEPLFDKADLDRLGKKSAAALSRVLNAVKRVCGIGEDTRPN